MGESTFGRRDASGRDRFRAIYEANYHRILGYALRRCANPDDAADVVAETFLVAWQRLDHLRRDDELLWLYGVARRVLANQRRGEGRRRQLGERLREELRRVAPSPFAEGGDGELDNVVAALAGLSDRDREVITLAAWEGLASGELAEVLGCSTNAAKIRLHRARRELARRLGAEVAPGAAKPGSEGRQMTGEAAEHVIGRPAREDPA